MSITVTSNADDLAGRIQSFDAALIEAMKRGLRKGVRLFEADMIKRQLTGRRADNMGLNRQSGNLAGAWYLRETGGKQDYAVTLANMPHAWYVVVHQHHNFNGIIRAKNKPYLKFQYAPGKWASKKEVYIPKRLTILEDFDTDKTTQMIRGSIIKEATIEARRSGSPLKPKR